MSVLSLNNLVLKLSNNVILDKVNFQIHPGDRIALVGRNGAGKSTLLKLLLNEITPDHGHIHKKNGLRIAGLTQDVPMSHDETVYDFLVKDLGPFRETLSAYRRALRDESNDDIAHHQHQIEALDAWSLLPKIENMASRLGLPCDEKINNLSGGMRRRALLGSALLAEPDLLLLDEPTNHLDLTTIEWLETYLSQLSSSVLLVTHDRTFLSRVANRIVEIDRGQLHAHECNYETYLDRREAARLSEQKKDALFDKRLGEEEAWLRQGVKARRTRNEGRVRHLKSMREAYRQRREQLGSVKSMDFNVAYAGKVVLECSNIDYSIGGQNLIHDFSFLLTRGDKVGIIGPNGCGKTTLLRLLLKEIEPDSGTIKHGTSLSIAYFDQLRRELDEQQTVMANVADGSDYVILNGQKKHVASYLSDFLFTPDRFNQPVFSLSGGERNRLLLAKLFAKPVNLLIMDEPTNDLDIETLELLESMLMNYAGTLLLISHDRAFINQIVSSVLIYEEKGHLAEFVGGYDDYLNFKKLTLEKSPPIRPQVTPSKPTVATQPLSKAEQKELKQLPSRIEAIEKTLAAMDLNMATAEFYTQDQATITQMNIQRAQEEATLHDLYARWEYLEDKVNG